MDGKQKTGCLKRAAKAPNTRKKDARLLYIMVLAFPNRTFGKPIITLPNKKFGIPHLHDVKRSGRSNFGSAHAADIILRRSAVRTWSTHTLTAIGAERYSALNSEHLMQLDINPTYGRDFFLMLPKPKVSGQVNRVTLMDPLLPSLQSLTGLTSVIVQVPVELIFFLDGTSEDFCSRQASVQYMQFPLVKGLGIHWEYQPSSPSLLDDFSSQVSYLFSNVTIHRVEFFSCSSLSLPSASSGSFSQRPLESQWHPSQFDRRYAMFYSRHQSEVRGTSHQRAASLANEAVKDSLPSASDATGSQLQSLPGLRKAVSLSRREATQEDYLQFSIDIKYVIPDIESNMVQGNPAAPTADNTL